MYQHYWGSFSRVSCLEEKKKTLDGNTSHAVLGSLSVCSSDRAGEKLPH